MSRREIPARTDVHCDRCREPMTKKGLQVSGSRGGGGPVYLDLCGPCDGEFQAWLKRGTNRCNKHKDCEAADIAAKAAGKTAAYHCHSEDCEECFGS